MKRVLVFGVAFAVATFNWGCGPAKTRDVAPQPETAQPGVTNWQGPRPPVRERETYTMLMAGLGLMGLMARRKKQAS